MASLSTTMTAAVERGVRLASVEFAIDVIRQLSSEGVLTCSFDEAMKLFDFAGVSVVSSRSKASKKRESAKASREGEKKSSKPKITRKPSVVLPFCGVIVNDWCAGVKFNILGVKSSKVRFRDFRPTIAEASPHVQDCFLEFSFFILVL